MAEDQTKTGASLTYLSEKSKDTKVMQVKVKTETYLDGELSITLNAPVKLSLAGDNKCSKGPCQGGFKGLLLGNI